MFGGELVLWLLMYVLTLKSPRDAIRLAFCLVEGRFITGTPGLYWKWYKSKFCGWLFVCLGFIVPLENFSLIWRRHHCWWRAANFDLCSTLMANEQWRFFNSMPHLLWHGASVYNGHLQGPVTLTPIAERLTVKLSLPVFTT